MRKFATLASLAVVAVGFTSIVGGTAFAATLHTGDLPLLSLTHNDLVPNQGFGYDKQAYDAQLARGNTDDVTTEQSLPVNQVAAPSTSDTLSSYPNEAHAGHSGNR